MADTSMVIWGYKPTNKKCLEEGALQGVSEFPHSCFNLSIDMYIVVCMYIRCVCVYIYR